MKKSCSLLDILRFKNRKEKLYGTAPAKGEKRVNVMAQHGFDKSITGLSEDTYVIDGLLHMLLGIVIIMRWYLKLLIKQ